MGQTSLAELLAATTLATDLGRGYPQEKALRTCLVATRVAEEHGLDERTRTDIFYAALIHPVGCTAFAHEIGQLFKTSEFRGIPAFSRVDITRPQEMMRAIGESSAGAPALRRARASVMNLARGKRFHAFAARADCEAGRRFTEQIGLGEQVARIVVQVEERWDGKGVPAGTEGEELVVGGRILALANQVELFHRQAEAVGEMVSRRADGWFDLAVVDSFERCAGAILGELESGSVWDVVLGAEPEPRLMIADWRIDDLATAIADMVDVKSPFFLGHSRGVSRLAEAAAAHLGLAADDLETVRRAGLVQDLGRLGVSNLIWDKPGPLTSSEWEQVRLHPYHSERILGRSGSLEDVARIAGMHHERNDGNGYHRGSTAASLPMSARILAAADVLQALTEPRPHREARPPEEASSEVASMIAAGALDPEAGQAVCECAGVALERDLSGAWPGGLTDREVDVLRLLARGLSKKQIAAELGIAQGTVHTHTGHIYEKLGVSTRAGVALFAMQHGLVRA